MKYAWGNLPVRRRTTLLGVMAPIAQLLQSPGTCFAEMQTLVSDPATFPCSGNSSRKAGPGRGSGLCFFQDDPWNAELMMLLASASKEASQEQNVFYLSISN